MKRLIIISILLVLAGCKSHKTSTKSEVSEKSTTEQVITQVDSSSTQTLRTYEEAIQWNYDRGTSIRFDSLSTIIIATSGVISASGYGARIDQRDSSKASRRVVSTEQKSEDAITRANKSKSEASERTEVTQTKEVKRGISYWIMVIVLLFAGITVISFYLFENFKPFKSLLKWIIKTLGRKS